MEKRKKIIAGIIAGVVIVILVGSITLIIQKKDVQIKQLNSETLNLGNSIVERDSMLNDLFSSLNDIESTLTSIRQKREQLKMIKPEGSVSMKESIIEDIRILDELLDKSTLKITILDKKIRESGIQIASMNKKIAELNENILQQSVENEQLKREIHERELQIAQLNNQVDKLSEEGVKKDESIAQKSELISKQDTELNKGYLAYGTFKQLKFNGVVEKGGGFLGLGRNKSINRKMDASKFMKLDIRETREIPLYAKKIRMITEHPDSSYSLRVENGLVTYLEIDNPGEFWKISKFAIIETK